MSLDVVEQPRASIVEKFFKQSTDSSASSACSLFKFFVNAYSIFLGQQSGDSLVNNTVASLDGSCFRLWVFFRNTPRCCLLQLVNDLNLSIGVMTGLDRMFFSAILVIVTIVLSDKKLTSLSSLFEKYILEQHCFDLSSVSFDELSCLQSKPLLDCLKLQELQRLTQFIEYVLLTAARHRYELKPSWDCCCNESSFKLADDDMFQLNYFYDCCNKLVKQFGQSADYTSGGILLDRVRHEPLYLHALIYKTFDEQLKAAADVDSVKPVRSDNLPRVRAFALFVYYYKLTGEYSVKWRLDQFGDGSKQRIVVYTDPRSDFDDLCIEIPNLPIETNVHRGFVVKYVHNCFQLGFRFKVFIRKQKAS